MQHSAAHLVPRRVRLRSPSSPITERNEPVDEPAAGASPSVPAPTLYLHQRFADRVAFRSAVTAYVASREGMPPPFFQKRASTGGIIRARCMQHADEDDQPTCAWTVTGRRVKQSSEWAVTNIELAHFVPPAPPVKKPTVPLPTVGDIDPAVRSRSGSSGSVSSPLKPPSILQATAPPWTPAMPPSPTPSFPRTPSPSVTSLDDFLGSFPAVPNDLEAFLSGLHPLLGELAPGLIALGVNSKALLLSLRPDELMALLESSHRPSTILSILIASRVTPLLSS